MKKKNDRKLIAEISQIGLLVGLSMAVLSCASNSKSLTERNVVVPQGDGTFLATVSNKSESQANSIAHASARQTCAARKQRVVILDTQKRTIQGALSEGSAAILDATAGAIEKQGGDSTFVNAADLTSRKVVDIKFKCQ